jgi:hypothetical protein
LLPPAPIRFALEFLQVEFKNNFAMNDPQITPGHGWELGTRVRLGGSLCIACAKRLCDRLDAMIDKTESRYEPHRKENTK